MSKLHPFAPGVSHPSQSKGVLPAWRVFAGLTLAPAAYALLIIAGYAVSAQQCQTQAHSNLAVWVIDLVAIIAILAGFGISLTNFMRTRGEGKGGHRQTQDIGDGRTRFLAYAGLCASAIFGLAALVQIAAILVIHRCLGLPALP